MIRNLGLTALRAAYLSGETSPRELIHILRKQALEQSDFNAWIHILEEEELNQYLDALESNNINDLPLYGIPFAIKDNIDLAGVPTTAACPDFSHVPEHSAFVVDCLIRAGAIPLGKTNLDQFATGLVGTRSPCGQGKNVFNTDYISGGSSSGSAIATALGQVSFALGTDTAGSGRVPAVLNNLIGHKPTLGLLSNSGVVPACKSLDSVSIFALNTVDAAAVLNVASQFDEDDAWARTNTFENTIRFFTESLPASFSFGVADVSDFKGNAECEALYRKSIASLEALGGKAVSIDFTPFMQTAKLLYEGPWVAERWLATQDVKPDSMLPVIREIISGASGSSAADAFSAQYRLKQLKQECDRAINNVDFVIMPTTPTFFTRKQIDEDPIANNSILGTYTNFINLLDYCATAVPVGQTTAGPYWGITLFARAFNDMKLLSHAWKLQKSLALPQGATGHKLAEDLLPGLSAPPTHIDVVVCGAHLQGQPLNWQLTERSAVLKQACLSAPCYKLYALSDGKRPAMMRSDDGGKTIEVEVWSVPAENFGSFVAGIPSPLGIGKVELEDGSFLPGFICEASGLAGATEITELRSWRNWLSVRK